MGRVGEHSLTRRRRRAGALATASPTTRRRPTHYAHYLSARGGRRHSPTSPLAGGPLTTRTNLVRGVGGRHSPTVRTQRIDFTFASECEVNEDGCSIAELMCALDLYEYHCVLWANTVPMVG